MKQRSILIFAFLLLAKFSFCQIIDRYGINIGASYSNQFWDYKLLNIDDLNGRYKIGIQAFAQAEKDLGKYFALRTELGYVQKGFKNNFDIVNAEGTLGPENEGNVILHDLALNIGMKIKPLNIKYSPYLLTGLRGDYMVSYKDIEVKDPGSGKYYGVYQSVIEGFNKFNLGGLIGLGVTIKDLIYFEVEYNPNFTNNLDKESWTIKDNCWGAKIGVNVNELIK